MRGAVVRTARNCSPDSVIRCTPSRRQASTTDGADRPATSSTATPTCLTARPTAGLLSCATTRTSSRSLRASSAVSSVRRSSCCAQITATAPASPALVSASSARVLVISGTPQASISRASGGSGASSTTTASTPDSVSSSTIRRPTPGSPQTITCPRQSEYAPPTLAAYSPTEPSMASRSRSASPACLAVSSIRCSSTQRSVNCQPSLPLNADSWSRLAAEAAAWRLRSHASR